MVRKNLKKVCANIISYLRVYPWALIWYYHEALLHSLRGSRRLYFIKLGISNNVASAPNCRKYTLENTEGAIKMGNPEKLATKTHAIFVGHH